MTTSATFNTETHTIFNLNLIEDSYVYAHQICVATCQDEAEKAAKTSLGELKKYRTWAPVGKLWAEVINTQTDARTTVSF